MLWSAVLTVALGLTGWILRSAYAEVQRIQILRNRTREEMAKEENLEGAAYAYQNLTANCLACHSYLTGQ